MQQYISGINKLLVQNILYTQSTVHAFRTRSSAVAEKTCYALYVSVEDMQNIAQMFDKLHLKSPATGE